MSYYQQEEVRRLIENYVAWRGDGVVHGPRGCIMARALSSIRRELDPRGTFPVTLGIDAGYTGAALQRLTGKLRAALLTYYTSELTFLRQARDVLHVNRSTYHRRLEDAHVRFMRAYRDEREAGSARLNNYPINHL